MGSVARLKKKDNKMPFQIRKGILKKLELIIYKYQKKIKRLYSERVRVFNLYKYEGRLRNEGYSLIAGIDEAGRGSLAGPVVAAAVILPEQFFIPNVKDSKKLTSKKRKELYYIILEKAIDVGIGVVEADIIDKINIHQASFLAMKRAIVNLKKSPEYLLVDGFKIPHVKISQFRLIKGEDKSISIAAASIMAKVYRDNIMIKFNQKYPQYCFKKNKGYGTQEHFKALKKYGATEIHRKTYNRVITI